MTDDWTQSARKKPNDEMFLSGSSTPKIAASPVLENWAIEETARGVIREIGSLSHLCVNDPDVAFERIKKLRWEGSRKAGPLTAAEAGTLVHSFMECWLIGAPTPDVSVAEWEQIQPLVDNLAVWMRDWKPEAVLTEAVVYNDYAKVAGRLDAAVRFRAGPLAGDRVFLIDLKTKQSSHTNKGYPQKPYGDTVAPQLAAYRWAEWLAPFTPRINTTRGRYYLLDADERAQLTPAAEVLGDPMELETLIIQTSPLSTVVFPIATGVKTTRSGEQSIPSLEFVKGLADTARGKMDARDWVETPIYESEH